MKQESLPREPKRGGVVVLQTQSSSNNDLTSFSYTAPQYDLYILHIVMGGWQSEILLRPNYTLGSGASIVCDGQLSVTISMDASRKISVTRHSASTAAGWMNLTVYGVNLG